MKISKEQVCVLCWFSVVNVIDNARNEQYQVYIFTLLISSLCSCISRKSQRGRSIAQAVIRRPLIVDAGIRYQAGQYVICDGQSSIGTSFAPCTFYLPCRYHSFNAPY